MTSGVDKHLVYDTTASALRFSIVGDGVASPTPRGYQSHSFQRSNHDWDATLALASILQCFLLSNNSAVVVPFTQSQALAAADTAYAYLGLDVIYDDALFESLQLQTLGPSSHSQYDDMLKTGMTLDNIVAATSLPLYLKPGRLSEAALIEKLNVSCYPHRDIVLDLMTHGKRVFMQSGFMENEGREVKAGVSYNKMSPIINDTIANLAAEGKVVLFDLAHLREHFPTQLKGVHCNPMQWATKWQKVKGRVCFNASHETKSYPSLNAMTDRNAHAAYYPPPSLPTLVDLCEMAHAKRLANPGKRLAGAAVDVAAAYQQCMSVPLSNIVISWVQSCLSWLSTLLGSSDIVALEMSMRCLVHVLIITTTLDNQSGDP
jgi:hypothetical protein